MLTMPHRKRRMRERLFDIDSARRFIGYHFTWGAYVNLGEKYVTTRTSYARSMIVAIRQTM